LKVDCILTIITEVKTKMAFERKEWFKGGDELVL
jgi:hypothetical protein